MAVLGILLAIFIFGMSIFVHELGHFLVAKWCGLKITSFSIGFGKALWKKTVNGVEYRLGFLPFGGYVALPQMLEGVLEDHEEYKDLPKIHPFKRMAVAVAGGIGNIIFAFLLAIIVWLVGTPAHPYEQDAIIGYVAPGSQAETAGLHVGQTILSVQGEGESSPLKVDTFEQVLEECALFKEVELKVQPEDPAAAPFEVTLKTTPIEKAGFNIIEGLSYRGIIRIGSVITNGAARAAGVLPEDEITHVDGVKMWSWRQMTDVIKASNKPLTLTVLRRETKKSKEGETIELTMAPMQSFARTGDDEKNPDRSRKLIVENGELERKQMVGIASHSVAFDFTKRAYPTPWQQIKKAGSKVIRILRAFTSKKTAKAAANAISGPVGIFYVLYIMREDLILMLVIAILINVNLAIVNMLPLPVLDGSQIVYSVYRLVTGRELPKQLLLAATNAFVVLLLMLMVFLVFRDVNRHFIKSPPPEGIEFISEQEALDRKLVTLAELQTDPFRVAKMEELNAPEPAESTP